MRMVPARWLQNIAVLKDTVCIRTCKRAVPQENRCPVSEQRRQATCGFIRQRRFRPPTALDRFPPRAQHRSYTNKMACGERHIIIERRLSCDMRVVTDLAYPTV